MNVLAFRGTPGTNTVLRTCDLRYVLRGVKRRIRFVSVHCGCGCACGRFVTGGQTMVFDG